MAKWELGRGENENDKKRCNKKNVDRPEKGEVVEGKR